MSRDKAEIIAYAIRKECQKCYWYETYGITFDEFEEFLSNGIKGSESQIPKKPSKDKYVPKLDFCPIYGTEVTDCTYCPHCDRRLI